jgi:hypothetical protein
MRQLHSRQQKALHEDPKAYELHHEHPAKEKEVLPPPVDAVA